MPTFLSEIRECGSVIFPTFSNTRIMAMPFIWGDKASIPGYLKDWIPTIIQMCSFIPDVRQEVGYLTIDEHHLKKGEIHRRPGLHVDGVNSAGETNNGFGGGFCVGGGFSVGGGAKGLLLAASHTGSRGYYQIFRDLPGADGDCSHLQAQIDKTKEIIFEGGKCYWLSPLSVHETIPAETDQNRQFIRISTPNNGWWFENYTANPLGIKPSGPIKPARIEMNYRK